MNANRPSFEDAFGGTYLLVEPGEFHIGDQVGSGHPNESPVILVNITEPFFLGVRPVTQMHWSSIMGDNPSKFQDGWPRSRHEKEPFPAAKYTQLPGHRQSE